MEDATLLNMWQTYNQRLDEALSINKKLLYEVQKRKANSTLRFVSGIKIFALVFGIIYLPVVLKILIYFWSFFNIFFIASAIIHLAVTLAACGFSVYHLVLIEQIKNVKSVVDAQEKLATLQTSTLWIYRISFLQLPVFVTAFMSLKFSPAIFYAQAAVALLFVWLSIWLFRNISLKNKDKKWMLVLLGGKEVTNITKAQHFLQEIEQYKN